MVFHHFHILFFPHKLDCDYTVLDPCTTEAWPFFRQVVTAWPFSRPLAGHWTLFQATGHWLALATGPCLALFQATLTGWPCSRPLSQEELEDWSSSELSSCSSASCSSFSCSSFSSSSSSSSSSSLSSSKLLSDGGFVASPFC